MSLESERVFGRNFQKFTSSPEVDDLEEVFATAEQILSLSFNFLRHPFALNPNKKMQELGDIGSRYIVREDLEFSLTRYEGLEDPDILVLDDKRMQVQIPIDFIHAAEHEPSEILYFAVFLGSKLRDQFMGLDVNEDESDQRAVLMQAEFLAWWEEASRDLEIDFSPTDEQQSLMGRFPHGIESSLDGDCYKILKVDARRIRRFDPHTELIEFDPPVIPYPHFEHPCS